MAQAKIIWAAGAYDDFDALLKYIEKDSIHYAAAIGEHILIIIESIGSFPHSGKVVSEFDNKNVRERVFQNYRIVYRIKKKIIEIIAIVHSARSIKGIL